MRDLKAKITRFYLRLDETRFDANWSVYLPMLIVFVYLATFNLAHSLIQGSKTLSFLISPQIFFFLSILVVAPFAKITPQKLGLSLNGFGKNVSRGFYTSLLPFALVVVFIVLPVLIWQFVSSEKTTLISGFASGPIPENRFYLIQLLILAPVFEEIFFRGFLIPPLKKRMPVWAVILISSLVFMLAHGYLKFGAFLLGILTSIIFLWSRSVIPGIIFHFTCNLWGPLLIYLFPEVHKTIYFLFK